MAKQKLKKDGTISHQGEFGGQPLKFNSPEEMNKKIEKYWDWAKEQGLNYTMTSLAAYLDIDYQTLLNYENCFENGWLKRCSDDEKRKYVEYIKRAKRKMVMYYEERLYDRAKTTGGIFALKNLFGWKDQQEIVTTNKETDISKEDIDKQLEELGVNIEDTKE